MAILTTKARCNLFFAPNFLRADPFIRGIIRDFFSPLSEQHQSPNWQKHFIMSLLNNGYYWRAWPSHL